MFTVIGFMLTGIIVGYLFRNIAFLQKTEKTISITIFTSVVPAWNLQSVQIELIINNLAAFGWQAAILVFFCYLRQYSGIVDGAEIFLQERR